MSKEAKEGQEVENPQEGAEVETSTEVDTPAEEVPRHENIADEDQQSHIDNILAGFQSEEGAEEELNETEEEGFKEAEEEFDTSSEEEGETEDPDPLQELRDEVANLREQLAEAKQEEEQTTEPEETEEEELQPLEFFEDDAEFEQALNSREEFNRFASRLIDAVEQSVLQSIPDVVSKTVERQSTQKEVISSWREENQDLIEQKPEFTGWMANQVQSEHPDWPLEKQLQETSKRVRKELGLDEEAKELEENRKNEESYSKPKTARKPRGGRGGAVDDSRSDQQKQIDQIIS